MSNADAAGASISTRYQCYSPIFLRYLYCLACWSCAWGQPRVRLQERLRISQCSTHRVVQLRSQTYGITERQRQGRRRVGCSCNLWRERATRPGTCLTTPLLQAAASRPPPPQCPGGGVVGGLEAARDNHRGKMRAMRTQHEATTDGADACSVKTLEAFFPRSGTRAPLL